MERWTISVPDDTAEDVMSQLSWGDNRSAWVVDAIEAKLDEQQADSEPDPAPEPTPAADPPDDIDAAIAAWRPPDDVEVNTENARDALRQAVAWLREQDGAHRKAEIVAGAYADGPLSERIWWARAVRPGLQALASVAVEGRKYRWVGGD